MFFQYLNSLVPVIRQLKYFYVLYIKVEGFENILWRFLDLFKTFWLRVVIDTAESSSSVPLSLCSGNNYTEGLQFLIVHNSKQFLIVHKRATISKSAQ